MRRVQPQKVPKTVTLKFFTQYIKDVSRLPSQISTGLCLASTQRAYLAAHDSIERDNDFYKYNLGIGEFMTRLLGGFIDRFEVDESGNLPIITITSYEVLIKKQLREYSSMNDTPLLFSPRRIVNYEGIT